MPEHQRFVAAMAQARLYLAGAGAGQPLVQAQVWPTRPIRGVVGTGPAGAPDILARIIGNRLGECLGQALVIDAWGRRRPSSTAFTPSWSRPSRSPG